MARKVSGGKLIQIPDRYEFDLKGLSPIPYKIALELVTPERAKELLKNLVQRQRNRLQTASGDRHVASLAKQMKERSWDLNLPQEFGISTTGELLNGAHRCSAIVASGIPMWAVMFYDVDPSAFEYWDVTRARSVSFRMDEKPELTAVASSVLRWMDIHGHGAPGRGVSHDNIERRMVIDFVREPYARLLQETKRQPQIIGNADVRAAAVMALLRYKEDSGGYNYVLSCYKALMEEDYAQMSYVVSRCHKELLNLRRNRYDQYTPLIWSAFDPEKMDVKTRFIVKDLAVVAAETFREVLSDLYRALWPERFAE